MDPQVARIVAQAIVNLMEIAQYCKQNLALTNLEGTKLALSILLGISDQFTIVYLKVSKRFQKKQPKCKFEVFFIKSTHSVLLKYYSNHVHCTTWGVSMLQFSVYFFVFAILSASLSTKVLIFFFLVFFKISQVQKRSKDLQYFQLLLNRFSVPSTLSWSY